MMIVMWNDEWGMVEEIICLIWIPVTNVEEDTNIWRLNFCQLLRMNKKKLKR